MTRRRERPARRAALLAAAIAVAIGIVGGGIPSSATAEPRVMRAAATESTPVDPAPSDPTPSPTQPSPLPSPSSSPTPVAPPPVQPEPWPGSDVPAPPPAVSHPSVEPPFASSASAIPAPAFGLVYPTNPWIYSALPGTRFLDEREREGDRVVRRHMGIDSHGEVRQPIFAVAAGIVVGGTWGTTRLDRHGYGNQVEIAHADGFATRYAHFAEAPTVRMGDHVTAGQLIGYMGGSQRGDLHALTRHLHFEVTKDGGNIDPAAFLTGAGTASEEAAVVHSGPQLYEIRPRWGDGYVSISTGLVVSSSVFTAVDMGGDSAQVMVSEGGTLKQLAVINGVWTEVDTQLPLIATSIAGANTGGVFPELFAVEDGKLFHIVGDASGWTKTWTGHYFSGTVSAVRMPGDQLHGMLQQAGYLYHLYPAQGGLWNVTDTRLSVGDQVDAVYVSGPAPDVMAVIDGQVQRITRGELTWDVAPSGLMASGSLAAVYQGGGWPIAMTTEPGAIGMTHVVDRMWTRYTYGLSVPGPIDAVEISGIGPVLYSIG